MDRATRGSRTPRRTLALAAAGMLAVSIFGSTPASAVSGAGHLIANPDAVRHGMTYPQWEGAYQIWVNEIPLGKNPLVHPDSPRNCELQPGNTIFAGASGANCHVPSGASIAFGTYFWECSTAEGLGDTWQQLRRCALDNFQNDLSSVHVTLSIDGVLVHHPKAWTFLTPGEIIDFPEHNLWGADPGPSKSVTKGTLYIIKSLPEGSHVVHAHVAGTQLNFDWVFEVG